MPDVGPAILPASRLSGRLLGINVGPALLPASQLSSWLLFFLIALLTISCSRDIQNTDAVKQGVTEYLKASQAKTGLNLDAMQIEVRSVSFERDEARANVYVTPKGMPTGGMQLTYVLARNGNKWVVRGRSESGANPHGNQMQEGSPGLPQQSLPPGHPQVPPGEAPEAPAGALPPGHPPSDRNNEDRRCFGRRTGRSLRGGAAGAGRPESRCCSTKSSPGKSPAAAASPTRPITNIRF